MFEYLFFDLDGTLTDPGVGITNSVMYSLKKFGIEVEDRTSLYKFIGPPLMESFRNFYGFNDEECAKAVVYYREYFGDKGKYENEVYNGIPELLQELNDKGYKLVLATSKPEIFAFDIMEHFGLAKYFHCMCGSSVHETQESKADVIRKGMKKCNIQELDKVIMIGDRMHDIHGAKECGIKSVGVMWGYGSTDEFNEYGADYTVQNLEELSCLIENHRR